METARPPRRARRDALRFAARSRKLPDTARMRLRLWHRLAIAFAGLSIAALLAFAWLQQQSLQRGFLDYLNRLSLERLAEPAQRLGEAYTRHGDWRFAWGKERALLRALGLAPDGADGLEPADVSPDGRPRGPGAFAPPPPRRDAAAGQRPPRGPGWDARPPRDGDEFARPQPPPRRAAAPLDLAQRLLLLDAKGEIVNGNPDVRRDSPSIAIKSGGRIVGRLLLQPLPRLQGDIDLAFARDQRKHAAIAAALVLLGAIALAFALSRWLLAPIRSLGQGTRALSQGDYATRLPTTRRDELGELARDFNSLAGALQANQQARQQWGADIAHELRTPISILRGEIQALQDGVRVAGPDTLASLQAECARLQSLVEDLYELSLSDAGALAYRFETQDLAALLREAVAAQQGAMRDAGLELTLAAPADGSLPVRADARRLAQLFGNLLNNSRRYTDAPGRVSVEAVRKDGWCRITIDDTAPGVPPDALDRVFDRLYRVEPSRSRAFGGAGLGLSICRNIVLAHGGRIDASAAPAGGLRIRILLPADDARGG